MKPRHVANQLRLMGWGFIIFGIIFVTVAFPNYDSFAHSLAKLFDWTGHPHSDALTRDARWFAAIMSGLSAGFGALYAFLVAPLLTVPNDKARLIAKRGGLLGVFIWFTIDSVGSFAAGVPSNVAMNSIFLLVIAGPLMMVKFVD